MLVTAALGLPAFGEASTPTVERTAAVQTLVVSADATAASVVRDTYGATAPPSVVWPIPAGSPMSSGLGARASCAAGCSTWHEGVDFNPGAGTPVLAATGGTVTAINRPNWSGLGQHVVIETVLDGQHVETVYAHLQYGSIAVGVGSAVYAGKHIGRVGSTGISTGAHLHFEVRVGGGVVDPLAWLRTHAN